MNLLRQGLKTLYKTAALSALHITLPVHLVGYAPKQFSHIPQMNHQAFRYQHMPLKPAHQSFDIQLTEPTSLYVKLHFLSRSEDNYFLI